MKTFAIILCLGFTSQVSHAFFPPDVEKCMVESGFTNIPDDLGIIDGVGNPNDTDKLKDVPKEKLAIATACMFHKEYTNTLYDMLKLLIGMNDKATNDQRQQMMDTLNTCHSEVKDNDAELLMCVKAFEAPFDYFIETLHMFGKSALYPCYGHCGLKIPDLYILEEHRNHVDELLKRIGTDNVYCITACKVERKEDNPALALYTMLSEIIDRRLKDDKNTEAKAALEKCYTDGEYQKVEMAGSLGETIPKGSKVRDTYQLLKCMKVFEEPWINLMRN
ncbi:uncharacterized protein LOC100120939 [Nasonia vitripennis]|uniref:Putative odorant binding protein 45 n=1 Tax=Nasonia vitripennis TaxID=7425 RepID=G8B1Q0_NASVI|nr:uncharacterized protein LOC100120939 [Nasonia vitripennis]CCD17814.1 putative odorant binding protein 45 [Nasonia vitripennis]